MELEDGLKRINGIALVEIEGFFTERYINLCKIRNVKIWNIKTIVSGIVRFNIATCDLNKLKEIESRTKCKTKILNTKGIAPQIKKYKKRYVGILTLIICIGLFIFSNSFIWNIEIVGNESIENEQIIDTLKNNNFYVGKNRIGLKNKRVINGLRVDIPEISWAGIEYKGTTAIVKIVEKTSLPEYAKITNEIGDIIALKSGTIKKIVVENGTAVRNELDYVNEGDIIIEGKIYSEFLEDKDVSAKGSVILDTYYEYNETLPYLTYEHKECGNKKYSIGITLNNKEYYINYLDKSLKYDIIKSSWNFKLFGLQFSLDFYTFNEYEEVERSRNKNELIEIAANNANSYIINEILPNLVNPTVISRDIIIQNEDDKKIQIRVVYNVNEQGGKFIERE